MRDRKEVDLNEREWKELGGVEGGEPKSEHIIWENSLFSIQREKIQNEKVCIYFYYYYYIFSQSELELIYSLY